MGRRPGPNRKPWRNTEWMDRAACADAPKALFNPAPPSEWAPEDRTPERIRQFHLLNDIVVTDYCTLCPVKAACAAYGAKEPFGTWGGLTELDRAAGNAKHVPYHLMRHRGGRPRRPRPSLPVLTPALAVLLRRRQRKALNLIGAA